MISRSRPFDPQRSRAVLIGCHESPECSDLEALPSVQHSLDAMSDLLEYWGLPHRNCERLSSRNGPLEPLEVVKTLKNSVKRAAQDPEETDLFLIYFSGHGYCLDDEGLQLALTGTSSVTSSLGSLSFKHVAHTVQGENFPARHVIVILDCCHAGAGLDHIRAENVDRVVLLAAAGKNELARSPVEDGPSFFTNALVKAVRELSPSHVPQLSLECLVDIINKQVAEHNRNLGIEDSDKHVPKAVLSPSAIRYIPWLPNPTAKAVATPTAPEPTETTSSSETTAATAPANTAPEEMTAEPVRRQPPAPVGLRWPWDYRTKGHPVLPRPKQFALLRERSRAGAVVPVTGEPGVGKRFLTESFLAAPEGVRGVLPQDPYVLELNLDLIRYNSPVPALRALQFTLGVTRDDTAHAALTAEHFAEARERTVARLAQHVGGRPLVLYITLRATRTDLRTVYEDLELLLAYPVFRNALVLLVTVRNAGGITGDGQLTPAAAVPVPDLERSEAAELIRQLLDEYGITGPDPEEALRLAGDDTMTLRPAVLRQAVAAAAARVSLLDERPDNVRLLVEEIRRATQYVIEPVLVESGCRLKEGNEPGALAILLAWVQLGAPPLVVDELPVMLKPLRGVVDWLRTSGVLVDTVPGGSPLEVTVGSAAQDSLREIRRRLQFSPEERYGDNRVPDVLLGATRVDEAEVDRLISKASAELLAHMLQFGTPASPDAGGPTAEESRRSADEARAVGALERALNELDELEPQDLSHAWSETRSILTTLLLARSVDTPFLPVDLEESQDSLGRLRSEARTPVAHALPPLEYAIAQLNVLSRRSDATPEMRDTLGEILSVIQAEFLGGRGLDHVTINKVARLTLLCGKQLDAADQVCDFRTHVLERLEYHFRRDYSPGRVRRNLALAGWGLQTVQLTFDHALLRRIFGPVRRLINSLDDAVKSSPSQGLKRLYHQLHLLQARLRNAPEEKVEHLLHATRIAAESPQVGMGQEFEQTLEAIVRQATATATFGCLLKHLLAQPPRGSAGSLTPVTRWRTATVALNSLMSMRAPSGRERLAILGDIAASGWLVPGSDRDAWVLKSVFHVAGIADRDSQGMHREALRGLREVKAGLERVLDTEQDWMVLRSWLTVTTMLSQRVWSETFRDAAGPVWPRWTAAVKRCADPRDPEAWSPLVGQELLSATDSPLVLPGPCPLASAPEPELEQRLRAVHADRRDKVRSFAERYGASRTAWFRAHRALERRYLHELAAISGSAVPKEGFREIYVVTDQPSPQYEFLTLKVLDEMADWSFGTAAKRADPARKTLPEDRRRRLLLLRADALLRQGLWNIGPGPHRNRDLETAHRELAESPKSAPGHWGEILRIRAACAFSPTPDPSLTGIPAELDSLLTSPEHTGFLQLAATLTDMGQDTAGGERACWTSRLTEWGATVETVRQLALFHLEQAERLCHVVPTRPLPEPDVPEERQRTLPSTVGSRERVRNRLVRAWACLNATVWLNPGSWTRRVALALDQGRVLTLAHLIWNEDATEVLELEQGDTGTSADLARTLLGFAARHSVGHSRVVGRRLLSVFGGDEADEPYETDGPDDPNKVDHLGDVTPL